MAESRIEEGHPADRVGCVREFTLKDGNHIREPLLALSDRDHVSTYCIRALRDGILTPESRHRHPLAAAAEAHRDLEACGSSGQIVLLP